MTVVRSEAPAKREPRAESTEVASLARSVLLQLWDNLPPLLFIDLVGLAVVLPALAVGVLLGVLPTLVLTAATAYPFFVGLLGSVGALIDHLPGSLWGHFSRAVQRGWLAAAALGLLLHVFLFSYLTTTAGYVASDGDPGLTGLWIVQSIGLVLLVSATLHGLPLVALYGLGPRVALRNGFVLAASAPLATMGMLTFLALLGAAVVWIGLGMWLIVPQVAAAAMVSHSRLRLDRLASKRSPCRPGGVTSER
jgi:hypothetical protein